MLNNTLRVHGTVCCILMVMTLMLSAHNACGQTSKLSPLVRETMLNHEASVSLSKGSNTGAAERRMNAFVRTSDVSVLRKNGCRILASFGDIHVASIPVGKLRTLASLKQIERIEAGRRCMALNDTAAIVVRIAPTGPTDPPRSPLKGEGNSSQTYLKGEGDTSQGYLKGEGDSSQGYLKGEGVVVGLMDIGFDLTHPTFYSSDMQRYRIKALWDQLDRTDGGQAVTGVDTTYVGRQYVGQDALLTLGHSYDGYIAKHGTHTAATAAGSGAEGKWNYGSTELQSSGVPEFRQSEFQFSGMAPDADICLVANATSNNIDSIPEDMRDMYNNTLDVLGFKYMFDYADAHGQPCVISFSEGSKPDLYSDDLLYEEVLNSMMGPGHILCSSAGNESYYNTYAYKPFGKAEGGAFIEPRKTQAYYMLRSSDKMTFRLTFYPPQKEPVMRHYHTDQILMADEEMICDTIVVGGREHVMMMAAYRSCFDENQWVTELLVKVTDDGYIGREIPVSITMLGDTVSCDAFPYIGHFTGNSANPSLTDFDNTHNILSPSGLKGVICVGSINSRRAYRNYRGEWNGCDGGEIGCHSNFSSIGPSVRGLVKPDVCAPGNVVISAASSWFLETTPEPWGMVRYFDHEGRRYGWIADGGTSMSCPVVAGVIATWLQACPTLTPEQAMEAIAATAAKPEDFADYPAVTDECGYTRNCYYGYGVIDAYEGLQYILNNFSGITETSITHHPSSITYDLLGRRVTTLHPGMIYIRNGKKITVR